MDKELEEALGLVKRTCELYIKSTAHLIGSDIIENQINDCIKPKPDFSLKINSNNTISLFVKKGFNGVT